MSKSVEPTAEKLRELLTKLAGMEKTRDWPLSAWAAIYQEKLALERQLNGTADNAAESV
jgi:hypothetical protein